ncbi:MAG: plasmid pRiA4b ORF-3 family protein [Nanoarchaeota archaeon]
MTFLQLKVNLKEIKPKIWRRFVVSDDISFDKLHSIIQNVMGWENYHLYSFEIHGERIELPDEEGYSEEESKNSENIKIKEYLNAEKLKFIYLYDFGDSWEHEIVVEKLLSILPDNVKYVPFCLEGNNACPPEDCGGVFGYEQCIQVLNDKKKSNGDSKELLEWLGNWKPDDFNITEVNKKFK